MSDAAAFSVCRPSILLVGRRRHDRLYAGASARRSKPWLMLSSPTILETRYLYELANDRVAFSRQIHLPQIAGYNIMGSSQGFLLSVDPTSADLHATHPFTGSHLPLPPTSALPNVTGIFRHASDRRIISYAYDYDTVSPSDCLTSYLESTYTSPTTLRGEGGGRRRRRRYHITDCPVPDNTSLHKMRVKNYQKAILSPSLDTLVVICRFSDHPLALARIGSSSWTALHPPTPDQQVEDGNEYKKFCDIIFHDGKLHAIQMDGSLAVFDLSSTTTTSRLLISPQGPLLKGKRFLLESPNGKDLFFLKAHLFDDDEDDDEDDDDDDDVLKDGRVERRRTRMFNVFRLEKNRSSKNYEWKEVESIGDLAFFVGLNHSFSLCTRTSPNLMIKPNCIYFTENQDYSSRPWSNKDMGVFDLADGTIRPLINFYDGLQNWPSAIWFIPPAAC